MDPKSEFDFSDTGNYYTFNPDNLTYSSKSKSEEGVTPPNLRSTVQQLIECLKSAEKSPQSPKTLDKIKNLEKFTHTLEAHLEEKIQKEHRIVGKLIVAFQKKFGTLSTLKKLETQFSDCYTSAFRQEIDTFLKAKPHDVVVDAKVEELRARSSDPIAEQIVKRYDQLAEVKKEAGLNNAETLKMAYFIECKLPSVRRTASNHFKRGDHDIPRSVIHDKKSGDVYVLLKHKVKLLDASGSFKKVTAAVRLPLIQQGETAKAQLMAQSVTKDTADVFERKFAKEEYTIHKKLQGMAGIWEVGYCTQYTTTKGEEKFKKITVFTRLADGDLAKVGKTLRFDERLFVAKQLIQGLHHMHQVGLIHWDIKRENALVRRIKGTLVAGWIDFGMTFKASKEPPTGADSYGTAIFTAPELLIGKKVDYAKADVWALGCALYETQFKKNLPWQSLLKSLPISNEKVRTFCKQIHDHVEVPLHELQKKSPLTKQEEFERLIYQMLRGDPADRIDMERALKEIDRIQKL